MKYYLLILIALFVLCSCASNKPFPTGDETDAPKGYKIHCDEYPDSIFCE